MLRVVPTSALEGLTLPTHRTGCGRLCAGVVSVLLSLASGFYYLVLLTPILANDLLWPQYNVTGYQAFLIGVTNLALQAHDETTLDLLGPTAVMPVLYASASGSVNVPTTYARSLLLGSFTSIDHAILGLRHLDASGSLWICSQYCWVDFAQVFEIAHTSKRQTRCVERYTTNAAVYFESVLRNVEYAAFLDVYGGPGNIFTMGLQLGLEESAYGRQWLATTAAALGNTSVENEAAYWRRHELTTFVLPWQNSHDSGIQETISIRNAIGIPQEVLVKNIPYRTATWTSINLNWFFFNDVYYMQLCNQSLIVNTTNYFLTAPPCTLSSTGDFEGYMGLNNFGTDYINQTGLVHYNVGPFLSIDALYIAIPSVVSAAYTSFQKHLFEQLGDARLWKTYVQLPTLIANPTPTTWQGPEMLYYGGNPLCLYGAPQTYVQTMFSFYDNCQRQAPAELDLPPSTLLFALAMTIAVAPRWNSSAICALQASASDCTTVLSSGISLLSNLPPMDTTLLHAAHKSLLALNLSLFQFATNDSQWIILTEALVNPASAHVLFGYAYVADWVLGSREAVSFEGDAGTFPLISAVYAPYAMSSAQSSLSTAASVILYSIYYSSAVLVAVALLCFGYGLVHWRDIDGGNLWHFHRLVGAVWVGRSVSFLRGGTALLVLSSTNLRLESRDGYTRFVSTPRSLLETLVVTSEATWVMYVLCDAVLVPLASDAWVAGPLGSLVVWLVFVVLDVWSPTATDGTLARRCSLRDVDRAIHCDSGSIHAGSAPRLWTLVFIQIGVICALGLVARRRHPRTLHRSASVPGILDAIIPLKSSVRDSKTLTDDAVTSVMAGIIPIALCKQVLTFNILLGTLEASPRSGPSVAPDTALRKGKTRWLRHLMALAGATYMLVSIFASVSYIGVSRTLLGNDLVWSDFNMTGAHYFLVTFFVQSTLLGAVPTTLTTPDANLYGSFNGSRSPLVVPSNFGAMLQLALSDSLETAVSGLRRTDGCHAPWLATAYCYVDWNKQWELANTPHRQQRCANSMTSNGAVYLETVLRNVPSDAWRACWGGAFDLAIGATLNETNAGRRWLASTTSIHRMTVDIADEAAYWRVNGISSFEMQWQNYKHIGLLQTYTVTSAFGSVYPFTIQANNGSFRFPLQTSFKMYWGFGSDLGMVLHNHTYTLSGTSLVRGSATYAYQNASSLESVLFLNGTLTAPLDEGLALVRGALGPFGSVDLHYVAIPASVQALLRSTLLSIATARVASTALQAAFDAVPGYLSSPVPPPWLAANFYALGGSPFCPTVIRNSGARIDLGLTEMFVSHSQCHKTSISSMLEPSATHVLVASALLPRETNWTEVCAVDPQEETACLQATTAATAFWSLVKTTDESINEGFEAAIADIMALEIQLFQLGATTQTAPATLYTYDIFDASDPVYRYYSWIYVYDWLLGKREVVRFMGDIGSLTLLSGRIVYAISSVATNEFPTNYATYAQAGNDYVTIVDIGLAGCTWMYIAISRGRVEGRNMLSLHSVGSVVWIGRPLLLLRSLTAISILSTATLRLTSLGPFATFVSDTPPWYTTLLAASEVTWLSAIVVDVGLPLTREFTRHFTLLNNLLVWTVSAALSFGSPNTHMLRRPEPSCVLAQVDWQVVCVAGDIAIGHRSRLITLMSVVIISHLMCFLVARVWLRQSQLSRVHSHVLSSGAIFLFAHAHWQRHGVLYMDRASAVFSGLLSLRYRGRLWVFDVKTWRVFSLPSTPPSEKDVAIATALPLNEST